MLTPITSSRRVRKTMLSRKNENFFERVFNLYHHHHYNYCHNQFFPLLLTLRLPSVLLNYPSRGDILFYLPTHISGRQTCCTCQVHRSLWRVRRRRAGTTRQQRQLCTAQPPEGRKMPVTKIPYTKPSERLTAVRLKLILAYSPLNCLSSTKTPGSM